MRGKRVKDLRRKLGIILGRSPVKQVGPKGYADLVPDPKGTVKGYLLVKGKPVPTRFTVHKRLVDITLIHEFRRFKRAIRRGEAA